MRIFLCCLIVYILSITQSQAKPPIEIPPKNPNDPERLPTGINKKVLIIGGGLAGLSAAIELADRGYDVTIKEKFDRIGGKLFCIPVEVFPNQTFYIEHGFHAWFHTYFQFKDIRNRLNINQNFRPWPAVHFVYKKYLPEVIYSKGPYPLNLLGIVARSPNLKFADAFASTLSLEDLLFYDFDRVNREYDNISFQDWAKLKHVAQDFYDIIMQPSLSVTLNERTVFSAAEMLAFMQIYFLTESEADNREVANVNYYQAVLKPWTEHLEALGTKIIYNSTVKSLKIDPKSTTVIGTIDESGDDPIVYDNVIFAADVGSVQEIFNQTIKNYQSVANVRTILQNINDRSISKMIVAPDYKVIRVWFDKQMNASAPDIMETPDFTPLNLIAQYSLLEEEFIDWARKTGGSVIEFHCYTWSKYFDPNMEDKYVWGNISSTVKQIYPEIFERDFKVLAYHVNSYQNFASFELGLMQFRPNTTTFVENKLNNLYIAGDWVRTPFPSALMERAVSTGRLAANEVLINDRVKQASLTVVNLKGPGI